MNDTYENPTSDDYMGVVMGIIMGGGNAKGLAFQAIQQAKAGEFAEAESSLNEASEQRLDNLAHRVIETDNIIFTGVGSSGLICDYAARRLAGVGINTFSFSDVTYPIASKLQNTTNILVIALSISGETNEIIEVLTSLRSNKDVYISSITPKLNLSSAELSDFVLTYRINKHRINTHYDLTNQLPDLILEN